MSQTLPPPSNIGSILNDSNWTDTNSGLTLAEASGLFLSLNGGTVYGSVNISGNETVQGVMTGSTGSINNLISNVGTISNLSSTSFSSNPISSHTATSGFTSTLNVGISTQNNSSIDLLANICATVLSATTGSIVMGVGSTSTPITDIVIPSITTVSSLPITFSAYLPSKYYLLVNTSGTISLSSINVQSMGI